MSGQTPKTLRARELGVSLRSLYYKPLQPEKDWRLKCQIEEVLRTPGKHSYGSPRIAIELKRNHKTIERVMKIFGIKAYRRRGRKWKKTKNIKIIYPNMLITTYPAYENHIWTSDFTYIPFKGKTVYVATVLDLFTRKVVGVSVYTNHTIQLTLSTFMNALLNNPRPDIYHSDNGSEYNARVFIEMLETVGVIISRSAPGCPWENGYQESFYSQFKVDLGDPSRFKTLGELVFEIYQTIWQYNNTRIHSALKMSPVQFALLASKSYNLANKDGVQ
jgi:transposase InsO family protein